MGNFYKTLAPEQAPFKRKRRAPRLWKFLSRSALSKLCPVRDWVYMDLYDDEALRHAYAKGTNLAKDGVCDRDEIIAAIERVYKASSSRCLSL
jgi:hypothetical protein